VLALPPLYSLVAPPVEAARTSNVEKVALKETTAACKAGAKEKKISWPTSRKYVNDCVAKAFKLTPAEIEKIAVKQATVACKAEAKGKKIGWPASRQYVKNCITTALNHCCPLSGDEHRTFHIWVSETIGDPHDQ
jgi:preprotein translocase subunit SecE